MIKTPLGNFIIFFNGEKIDYTFREEKNTFGNFSVERRFDIFCDKFEQINIGLDATDLIDSFDSDESYSVKFWENDEYIVGVGFDCTYPELIYEQLPNCFFIKQNKRKKLKIRLVWNKKTSENSELACWYGADPKYE